MGSTAYFVYGIVPADVEATDEARGVGEPPAPVAAVPHGRVAALVSEVPMDHPLGRPDDLVAYQRLLDSTASAAPVLPVRFGTAMADIAAVEEFLASREDGFASALAGLEGHAEFVVRARYVIESVLTQILADNAEAAALRDKVGGQPEALTVDARMRLGEIVSQAVEAERAADTGRLVAALARSTAACRELPPSHEEDAATLAVLVETARRAEFEEALRAVVDEWQGRVTVRLLGPLAPYDFTDPPDGG